MKAIEVTGKIDAQGNLILDERSDVQPIIEQLQQGNFVGDRISGL